MNSLTKIGLGMFVAFVTFSMFSNCGRKAPQDASQPSIETQADVILKEYAKGLDLDAVTALAKKSKDAADFERLLNSESEAVNNIDLNDDGKVDYINITEYGNDDNRGFSLTTRISEGKIQEIASIDFKKEGDKTVMQTTGNSSLYGPGHYHHSSFSMTDAILMGWLFSNRPSYSSPYDRDNYPPSYGGGWSHQPYDSYGRRMSSRSADSSVTRTSSPVISQPVVSPNAQKTAAKAKALTTATQSQRSFTTSSNHSYSSNRSGGFGRSSSSSFSRSGGSFGGGK